jgi:hypothetical protein
MRLKLPILLTPNKIENLEINYILRDSKKQISIFELKINKVLGLSSYTSN